MTVAGPGVYGSQAEKFMNFYQTVDISPDLMAKLGTCSPPTEKIWQDCEQISRHQQTETCKKVKSGHNVFVEFHEKIMQIANKKVSIFLDAPHPFQQFDWIRHWWSDWWSGVNDLSLT